MNATAPDAPDEIRGKTLTPESPKPLHYPSPANIPILEAQMDPAFSETVMQSMPLPSVAQHTMPATNPAISEIINHHDAYITNGIVDGEGTAPTTTPGSCSKAEQSTSDSQSNAANQSLTSGTPSLPHHEPSEAGLNHSSLSAVDTSSGLDRAGVDIPSPAAPDAQQAVYNPNTNFDIDAAAAVSTGPVNADAHINYDALLANLSSTVTSTAPADSALPTPTQAAKSPVTSLPSNPNLRAADFEHPSQLSTRR